MAVKLVLKLCSKLFLLELCFRKSNKKTHSPAILHLTISIDRILDNVCLHICRYVMVIWLYPTVCPAECAALKV